MSTVAAEFDEKAAIYESYRLSSWYKAHTEILLGFLPDNFNGTILDIGCGTGYLLRRYLLANPSARGIGIDIASKMTAIALEKSATSGISNVEYIHADWETFDRSLLVNSKIDLIVCANTFHYFSDPERALEKMHSVLRRGSVLILERDRGGSPLTAFWDLLHRRLIKDNVVFYDTNTIQDMFIRAGFSNPKLLASVKKYFWHRKLYTNIAVNSFVKQ